MPLKRSGGRYHRPAPVSLPHHSPVAATPSADNGADVTRPSPMTSTSTRAAQDWLRIRPARRPPPHSLDRPLSAAERAALPLAMARQPLSSIGGWVARLDDEVTARRHAARVGPELVAARQLMTELGRW